MKVFIAGASGLLGQCVWRELASAYRVEGSYCGRPRPGLRRLAIEDTAAVREMIAAGGFTHIVNCAGLRSPEYCREHPDAAYAINGLAVENLARAADSAGALLLHISTDYVFNGERPPYREDDLPNPINFYGRSKLAGEHAAQSARRHLVLRIPALWRADLTDERNVATDLARRLRAGERLRLDAETVRYYTLAEDVARAIRFCLERGCEGILHVTAEQKTSKADFARRLARALRLADDLVEDAPPPPEAEARPLDSHLCADKYKRLGGPAFSSVDEGMKIVSATNMR
ncbi:MAG: SDR family oxidoreductase [Planctomycetota bacterium]|nr:SDR family oxidoreductase [Planctomycetota bacterium]